MKKSDLHDEKVRELEKELSSQGILVRTFVEYHINGFDGEIDALAIYEDRKEFYEIKTGDHPNAEKKAKRQYARYLRVFNETPETSPGYLVIAKTNRVMRL